MVEEIVEGYRLRQLLILMEEREWLPTIKVGQKKVDIKIRKEMILIIHNEPLTSTRNDRIWVSGRDDQRLFLHAVLGEGDG